MQDFSNGFLIEFGVNVNGIGVVVGLVMFWFIEVIFIIFSIIFIEWIIGFVFIDDDGLDNFIVNIKIDLVYGIFVFEVVSGQLVCFWEFNMQFCEEV